MIQAAHPKGDILLKWVAACNDNVIVTNAHEEDDHNDDDDDDSFGVMRELSVVTS